MQNNSNDFAPTNVFTFEDPFQHQDVQSSEDKSELLVTNHFSPEDIHEFLTSIERPDGDPFAYLQDVIQLVLPVQQHDLLHAVGIVCENICLRYLIKCQCQTSLRLLNLFLEGIYALQRLLHAYYSFEATIQACKTCIKHRVSILVEPIHLYNFLDRYPLRELLDPIVYEEYCYQLSTKIFAEFISFFMELTRVTKVLREMFYLIKDELVELAQGCQPSLLTWMLPMFSDIERCLYIVSLV